MGICYGYEAQISANMQKQIHQSAEKVLMNGSYLRSKCCGGLSGAAALSLVTSAVHECKDAESSQKLLQGVAAKLPLVAGLSDKDFQLCDLRGCTTVGDVANALLQRIVVRFLVSYATSYLWPTARTDNSAVHPCCWAVSYATGTCICVSCYESRVPFPFMGICPCGPCCLGEATRTAEATADFRTALHGVPPLAVIATATSWRRVLALHKPPHIDVLVSGNALKGGGAARVDDKNWNWVDMHECIGFFDRSDSKHLRIPPVPVGFIVVAEDGVVCNQGSRSNKIKNFAKGEKVFPLKINGETLELKGGFQCSVISEAGVRLLTPLTTHWRVLEDEGVPTFSEKPTVAYWDGVPGSDLKKDLLEYATTCVAAEGGGIDGAWLQLESGRWAPIYDQYHRRLLLPIPGAPVRLTEEKTVLKIDPDRFFFEPSEFPQLAIVAQKWEALRAEALALWKSERKRFVEFEGHHGWKACALKLWGHDVPGNMAVASVAAEAMAAAGIDGLTTFCYSVLQGGAHIRPHEEEQGTSCIRAHLGLNIPEGCALRVGPYAQVWKEGTWTVFNGNRSHEALNGGMEDRVVVLVDFGGPSVDPSQWPGWMEEAFKQSKDRMPSASSPPPPSGTDLAPLPPGILETTPGSF